MLGNFRLLVLSFAEQEAEHAKVCALALLAFATQKQPEVRSNFCFCYPERSSGNLSPTRNEVPVTPRSGVRQSGEFMLKLTKSKILCALASPCFCYAEAIAGTEPLFLAK